MKVLQSRNCAATERWRGVWHAICPSKRLDAVLVKTLFRNQRFVSQWCRYAVSKGAITVSGIGGLLLMLFLHGRVLLQRHFSAGLCLQALLTVLSLNSVTAYSAVQVFLQRRN
jgi:hypothetical protein